ncbi:hypothetical protein SLNSH_10065 [Alsobacter soli]|uniref:Uncharacterized protein n=1 Tax=Alsobacter soli TaxID=2109933 RepID=A0A2T1HU35_9HYPH|nr:hypothetical protein [Alsobacter soli]PSC05154.1 hypothetical protein SLNSH_10065 [Alsobacter soli]
MKPIAVAVLALGVVGSTAAMAQSVTIDTGGRYGRDHDWDSGRRYEHRWDRGDRYRRFETGSVDCRTVTIRKRNFDGDLVVRRIRRCD